MWNLQICITFLENIILFVNSKSDDMNKKKNNSIIFPSTSLGVICKNSQLVMYEQPFDIASIEQQREEAHIFNRCWKAIPSLRWPLMLCTELGGQLIRPINTSSNGHGKRVWRIANHVLVNESIHRTGANMSEVTEWQCVGATGCCVDDRRTLWPLMVVPFSTGPGFTILFRSD